MTIINTPRDLPQLDEFIELDELREMQLRYGRAPLVETCRVCIEDLRQRLLK